MTSSNFDRIVGYKEEKKELSNICNLIKKRDELKNVGGKLPRGLCLIGPNGVGKTILAKCFIEESQCDCVVINYNDIDDNSDFVTYIKTKFNEAASKSPCILFIDELDKLIGNSRHFFMEENFDKSRVILNEINKYSDIEGLFLLIVANKEYILDRSIIRSGRIDNIIEINLPTKMERDEILSYYAIGKQFDSSVDFERISKMLNGFSGADIESLLNGAVIKSFIEKRMLVSNNDIMNVFYDKIFECKAKEFNISPKKREMIAYHEAGHATISLLIDYGSINCITILSRNGVKGFVNQNSLDEGPKTLTDERNQIMMLLGGLVSEEVFFNDRTTGSSNDINKARQIISNLVRKHGMCGINKTVLVNEDYPPLDRCSESKQKRIEEAEDSVLENLYNKTKEIIKSNKDMVVFIASELMKKHILNKEDIDYIVCEILKKEKEPIGSSLS